ncbi:3-keto-disaccharide hydrolase [Formosa sp. 3Alg 14/1]|uniref:3-keto-disaccharide hydrolase n=1 Tax=Formosa sp. 3Alg 14/1 TaxID=3382190 RepID=UPI0039BDE61F
MKAKLQACCLIAMITWGGTIFSQTKLKSLEDFKTPTGDWFMAKDVKVDSVNHKLFTYAEGGDSFVNGATGKTVHLESKEAFGDIELHLEFLLPEGSNSGIYFQSRYEIQIFDSYGKENIDFSDCGGIYQRWDESKPKKQKGYEGITPRVNATKSLGEWQTCDIIFRAPKFDANGKKVKNAMFEKVVLNGVIIHENKEVTGATREGLAGVEVAKAPLRLQGDHGRVAFRNIRIRDLENTRATKLNIWVDVFENTEKGPNYDFVVQGDATEDEAKNMFEYSNGELKAMDKWTASTAPYGVAITKKRYSSYDLKFEFKWGERRFEPRLNEIRDAGLLYHCQAGTYAWPPSLEYQIQEGDCGDLWSILGVSCDVLRDGEILVLKKADYSRSKKFVDKEKSGWNKVLLKVRGDSAQYYLNGVLVNEIINSNYAGVSINSGFIALQAEYSELIYRNIKIMEK